MSSTSPSLMSTVNVLSRNPFFSKTVRDVASFGAGGEGIVASLGLSLPFSSTRWRSVFLESADLDRAEAHR